MPKSPIENIFPVVNAKEKPMRMLSVLLLFCIAPVVVAQQTAEPTEKRVALNEAAQAFDASGAVALEASLTTTGLNGTVEAPVTSVRMVVRNAGPTAYNYVSGVVTVYDNAGVRCGEGAFKADVLAAGESFETDAPGIRIRCTPTSWRIMVTNLVPRVSPIAAPTPTARLVITVDGEEHPIQLSKPLTLNLGERKRTIVVREVP
jgi:hypothetical protein